jgi:hypothetical protein
MPRGSLGPGEEPLHLGERRPSGEARARCQLLAQLDHRRQLLDRGLPLAHDRRRRGREQPRRERQPARRGHRATEELEERCASEEVEVVRVGVSLRRVERRAHGDRAPLAAYAVSRLRRVRLERRGPPLEPDGGAVPDDEDHEADDERGTEREHRRPECGIVGCRREGGDGEHEDEEPRARQPPRPHRERRPLRGMLPASRLVERGGVEPRAGGRVLDQRRSGNRRRHPRS